MTGSYEDFSRHATLLVKDSWWQESFIHLCKIACSKAETQKLKLENQLKLEFSYSVNQRLTH